MVAECTRPATSGWTRHECLPSRSRPAKSSNCQQPHADAQTSPRLTSAGFRAPATGWATYARSPAARRASTACRLLASAFAKQTDRGQAAACSVFAPPSSKPAAPWIGPRTGGTLTRLRLSMLPAATAVETCLSPANPLRSRTLAPCLGLNPLLLRPRWPFRRLQQQCGVRHTRIAISVSVVQRTSTLEHVLRVPFYQLPRHWSHRCEATSRKPSPCGCVQRALLVAETTCCRWHRWVGLELATTPAVQQTLPPTAAVAACRCVTRAALVVRCMRRATCPVAMHRRLQAPSRPATGRTSRLCTPARFCRCS